jgi:hypothetical protein
MIARFQMNRLSFYLGKSLGFALQHDHSLDFLLIVPEAFRARVLSGHGVVPGY